MKISIWRSGGFAGITEQIASIDTANLNQPAAVKAENLVRDAGFFSLPASPPGQSLGSDFLKYEVKVSDQGREHTITFNDDDAPATSVLRKFVEQITQL